METPPLMSVSSTEAVDVNPFRHLARASKPLFAAPDGAVFSLALRGKLIAAAAGAATLTVDRVRQYPGGRWLEIDERTVELTVPLGTELKPISQARKAALVTAYTLKANTTPAAIVGAPGALLLGRVAASG